MKYSGFSPHKMHEVTGINHVFFYEALRGETKDISKSFGIRRKIAHETAPDFELAEKLYYNLCGLKHLTLGEQIDSLRDGSIQFSEMVARDQIEKGMNRVEYENYTGIDKETITRWKSSHVTFPEPETAALLAKSISTDHRTGNRRISETDEQYLIDKFTGKAENRGFKRLLETLEKAHKGEVSSGEFMQAGLLHSGHSFYSLGNKIGFVKGEPISRYAKGVKAQNEHIAIKIARAFGFDSEEHLKKCVEILCHKVKPNDKCINEVLSDHEVQFNKEGTLIKLRKLQHLRQGNIDKCLHIEQGTYSLMEKNGCFSFKKDTPEAREQIFLLFGLKPEMTEAREAFVKNFVIPWDEFQKMKVSRRRVAVYPQISAVEIS